MLGCKGLSCMDLSTSRADATTGIHNAIEVYEHIFVKMHIIYDFYPWLISFKLLSFWMEKGQISIVEKDLFCLWIPRSSVFLKGKYIVRLVQYTFLICIVCLEHFSLFDKSNGGTTVKNKFFGQKLVATLKVEEIVKGSAPLHWRKILILIWKMLLCVM